MIALTWLVAIVLALPYLYCKSYAFSIESHLGSVSRFICTDRFDEIDAMMYGAWQPSTDDYDGLYAAASSFKPILMTARSIYVIISSLVL